MDKFGEIVFLWKLYNVVIIKFLVYLEVNISLIIVVLMIVFINYYLFCIV